MHGGRTLPYKSFMSASTLLLMSMRSRPRVLTAAAAFPPRPRGTSPPVSVPATFGCPRFPSLIHCPHMLPRACGSISTLPRQALSVSLKHRLWKSNRQPLPTEIGRPRRGGLQLLIPTRAPLLRPLTPWLLVPPWTQVHTVPTQVTAPWFALPKRPQEAAPSHPLVLTWSSLHPDAGGVQTSWPRSDPSCPRLPTLRRNWGTQSCLRLA